MDSGVEVSLREILKFPMMEKSLLKEQIMM